MMGQDEQATSTHETRCSSRGSTWTTKNQSSKNKVTHSTRIEEEMVVRSTRRVEVTAAH